MPELLYHRNAASVIGISIRLDGGEKVWVLYSRHGCVVRKQGFFYKPTIYYERSLAAVTIKAKDLKDRFPDMIAPLGFEGYALPAIVNAIWHCRRIDDVRHVLNGD